MNKTLITDAMAVMLREECGLPDVERVTEYEQYEASGGACDTCRWTEIRVRIDYVDDRGRRDSYDYRGDMAALIRALTR